jgi:hypothetical protein
MAIQTNQKEEEKARERELLRALLSETTFFDTYDLLNKLFGKFKNLQELPVRSERLKQFPISYLSLAISHDTFVRSHKAISYLYPAIHDHISELRLSPPQTLTFALTGSLFRFWAVLSSDRLKKVIYALANLDISELIEEHGTGIADPQRAYRSAVNEISSCLRILKASWDDVKRLFDPVIVSIPSPDELELIAKSRKPYIRPIGDTRDNSTRIPAIGETIDNSTRRNQYDHQLILCIDPYNELDEILAEVRGIIELHHKRLKEEFYQQPGVPGGIGFSIPTRHPFKIFKEMSGFSPYFDKKLFNEIDPLQYFQFKEKGDKGRDVQKITDDNFHALLTFDLRKRDIRPVDIERRFFGLTAAPKTRAYKAQTKAHNDHYKRAERLIGRALACAPIQS